MWAHLGSRREQQGNFQGSFPLCTPWKWWKKSVLSKCKEFRNWFEMFNINIHLQAFICTYIHTWVIEVFLSIWKWKHKAITFGARGNTGTCCREKYGPQENFKASLALFRPLHYKVVVLKFISAINQHIICVAEDAEQPHSCSEGSVQVR